MTLTYVLLSNHYITHEDGAAAFCRFTSITINGLPAVSHRQILSVGDVVRVDGDSIAVRWAGE